jgi:endonuclease G, mitochondrial
MSNSESVISATSVFGPIRIELFDQHSNRLARGFGQLRQSVAPGVYSLQYGSGLDFREELIRVAKGQVVERKLEVKISTAAPISTSVSSREFHRGAAQNLSRNPTPHTPGARAGLMVFARVVDADGRGPVSLHRLSLLDSSLNPICNLQAEEFQHPADGWAGACLEVAPGGYALKWTDDSDPSSGGVLQSLWVSPNWITIIFIGYAEPANEVRHAGDVPSGPDLFRQAASIHMAQFGIGFNSGPEISHLQSQPQDWESHEARVGQALELALLGLRSGSSVVPDDLLDLLLQAKFQNPMLGIVGAYGLLQRRKKDWTLFNTVLRNLDQLLGPGHPDVSALAAMALNQGNLQSAVQPKPVNWPPMLTAGYRAIVERDWRDAGALVELASVADNAAAALQPEFPWTCWATDYVGVDPVTEGIDSLFGKGTSGERVDRLGALLGADGRPLSGEALATYSLPIGTSSGTTGPSATRPRSASMSRMMRQVRTLKQLDPSLRMRDLRATHFRQLGLSKGTVEDALATLRFLPDEEDLAASVDTTRGEGLMPTDNDLRVERIAKARIAGTQAQIEESLKNIAAGNPLGAEKDTTRLVRRLMSRNQLSKEEAGAVARGVRATAAMVGDSDQPLSREQLASLGAEAIWGDTIDFVGVSFLERGLRVARSVARIAFSNGRPQGTGFLIAQGLLMTNNHVISTPAEAQSMVIEFDYELDLQDKARAVTTFALEPAAFFVTQPVQGLDFTVVAVGARLSGSKDLAEFGWCPLSAANDKHAIGEAVNIIQHPRGRYKEVVLRENRLVARAEDALHYAADTEPGASGSPVYNSQWQAIALHHWGGPFHAVVDDRGQKVPAEINEGIRISAIVKALAAMLPQLSGAQAERLKRTLALWESVDPVSPSNESTRIAGPVGGVPSSLAPRANVDGTVTLTLPLEITIGLGGLRQSAQSATTTSAPATTATVPTTASGVSEATKPSSDYDDRIGYDEGFIPGHVVPLPGLTGATASDAARLLAPHPGALPYELKYHHFSSVVSKKRHLALFVACNIDGKTSKFINRDTGQVSALDPSNPDHGLMEAAEASEKWYDDPRLVDGAVAGQSTYSEQVVAGFPAGMGRTLRMFQRGHLVRRLDPAWGTKSQALLAEADTFHFTNCVPQVGFFNMGRANPATAGTGGGRLWRAVENLVLRNARNTRSRVSCFTGPIFDTSDRAYRNIKIPQRFFKIAVWAEEDGLRSLAMIADQSKVLKVWPEALFTSGGESIEALGAEAFQDPDELERVDDFLTTIAEVESLTGLDFGDAVRDGDIRFGSEALRPRDLTTAASVIEIGNVTELLYRISDKAKLSVAQLQETVTQAWNEMRQPGTLAFENAKAKSINVGRLPALVEMAVEVRPVGAGAGAVDVIFAGLASLPRGMWMKLWAAVLLPSIKKRFGESAIVALAPPQATTRQAG